MFFQRKKDKDKSKQKKKWEEELEEANDKPVLSTSIACSQCQEELVESGLFCTSCQTYFCCAHFQTSHGPEERSLLQSTTTALLQFNQERWKSDDEKAERERESNITADTLKQEVLERHLEECVHPGSRGEAVKRSELGSFASLRSHPAAIQNMDLVRAVTKARRDREIYLKNRSVEEAQETATKLVEREAFEKGLVKDAMVKLQEQGKIHRFRPLVGDSGVGPAKKECLRLRVGWMVAMPECQMIRKQGVPPGESDEEDEHTEEQQPVNVVVPSGTSVIDGEREEQKDTPSTVSQSHQELTLVRKVLATFAHEVSSDELRDFFSGCGTMKDMHLRHKGEAIIKFDSAEGAQHALALNMKKLHGRPVFINIYDPEGVAKQEDKEPAGTKFRLCFNFKRGTCFKGDCPDAHHPRELTPFLQMRELAKRQKQSLDRYDYRKGSRSRSRSRHKRSDDFGRDAKHAQRSRSSERKHHRRRRSRSKSPKKKKRSRSR